jgi:5-formyltetrahydrofolate cyclo-ligase
VLRPDNDLDWIEDLAEATAADTAADTAGDTAGDTAADARAMSTDAATLLGLEAVSAADLVVCPATGTTPEGDRLGKGGGSYDRVLARLDPQALVVALVHDDEVATALPTEAHDRRVDVIVTPTRTLRA